MGAAINSMQSPQWWPSPAKINLFLHVIGQRANGYHELQTVFQFLDLMDNLKFEVVPNGDIKRAYDLPGVDYQDDLIVQAAKLLQSQCEIKPGVRISLNKKIPIGGGLGGASSNVATTLVALNRLWNAGLDKQQMLKLAAQLGADVPVFIYAQSAWAEGIGEQLSPVELSEPWYLVVNSRVQVSTAKLFRNPQLTRDHPRIKICAPEPGQLGNDFESLVRSEYVEVDRVFKWLDPHCKPFLTGTGGCVVAAFDDRANAEDLLEQCPRAFESYVAKGYNRSLLAQYMS